jgi:hypothetical protein
VIVNRPAALVAAWHAGKLDVVCSNCGRAEAANRWCSGCGHEHEADEYRLHRPGVKGHGAGSCALHGAVYPEARNAGWGDGFSPDGTPTDPRNATAAAAQVSSAARKHPRTTTEAVGPGAAIVAPTLGLA